MVFIEPLVAGVDEMVTIPAEDEAGGVEEDLPQEDPDPGED